MPKLPKPLPRNARSAIEKAATIVRAGYRLAYGSHSERLIAIFVCPLSAVIAATAISTKHDLPTNALGFLALLGFVLSGLIAFDRGSDKSKSIHNERLGYIQEILRRLGLEISNCGRKVYHQDKDGKRIPDMPGLDPLDDNSYA